MWDCSPKSYFISGGFLPWYVWWSRWDFVKNSCNWQRTHLCWNACGTKSWASICSSRTCIFLRLVSDFRLVKNPTFLICWNVLRRCNDNCNGCSRTNSPVATSRSKSCRKSCMCGLCNEQKASWTSRISRESRINASYSYGSKCGRLVTIILFLKYEF